MRRGHGAHDLVHANAGENVQRRGLRLRQSTRDLWIREDAVLRNVESARFALFIHAQPDGVLEDEEQHRRGDDPVHDRDCRSD